MARSSSSGGGGKARKGPKKLKNRLAGKQLPPELLEQYNTPVIAPEERELEGRKVHRVREYWLEYEAMEHLQTLQDFVIPLALFEKRMREANKNNSRFVEGSIDESARVFFREFLDEKGVPCLQIKMSEKVHFSKPSKNILKRWNLSNGMLYFFYTIVGRNQPPSAEEILGPFYHQKRIDFINKICLVPTKDSSHGSRKRRRDANEPIMDPSELQVEAPDDVNALCRNLKMFLGQDISEASVKQAVERGVWQRKVVYEDDQSGDDEEEDFMNRRARTVWTPNLDKVEEWTFDNGTLHTFTRACRMNWSTIQPVWHQWNDDLGNNAIEWEDLWGTKKGTVVKEEESLGPMVQPENPLEEELYYLDTNPGFEDEIVMVEPSTDQSISHQAPYYETSEEYFPSTTPTAASSGMITKQEESDDV